ncbi:hypothetical protein [Polaromonas glacialis]|uniref:hypothetical protein n=1 Tax=Polaromonas glacialis TaxID=866564 RepID=UPI0012EC944F|nr:hypothetical protein [Polaromonas glacialis]
MSQTPIAGFGSLSVGIGINHFFLPTSLGEKPLHIVDAATGGSSASLQKASAMATTRQPPRRQ